MVEMRLLLGQEGRGKRMTTQVMTIYCSQCREGFPMYPDRSWYNFIDESYADPVGFCSPKCLEMYAVARKWKGELKNV